MRPYVVQIFKAYESPLPPDECAAILGFLDNIAQLTFIFLVRFTGKRPMYLLVTTGVCLSTFIISVYGFIVLPSGFNSFNQESQSFHVENKNHAYIPLFCLFFWEFFSYCNFISMVRMLSNIRMLLCIFHRIFVFFEVLFPFLTFFGTFWFFSVFFMYSSFFVPALDIIIRNLPFEVRF